MSTKKIWEVLLAGCVALLCAFAPARAWATPINIEIDDVLINDADHNQDGASTLYRYMVSSAFIGNQFVNVGSMPHVGVCTLAQPGDYMAGCANRINPAPGTWHFRVDVPQTTGTVNALIQIRNTDASKINSLDLSPGATAPADWGLGLVINLDTKSWTLRGGTALRPLSASSTGAPGALDPSRVTGSVNFNVTFCDNPTAEDVLNGVDDDCNGLVDECRADQIGTDFDCVVPNECGPQNGSRMCNAAGQPPSACVQVDPNPSCNTCPAEVNVTNVLELRDALVQANQNHCRDVIVLAPGVYEIDGELQINSSLELRGQGSAFGCVGLDVAALDDMSLSPDLGSLRCDGDDGESPGDTVLVNRKRPANHSEEPTVFGRVMQIGEQDLPDQPGIHPEVTLRHLSIRNGFSAADTGGDEGLGIQSFAQRLELYNVVVERNVARAPGAGIQHTAPDGTLPDDPTFILANSTVRENRNTVESLGAIGLQGDGGGIRLFGGSAFVLRSTIAHNAALRGGGISSHSRLHIYNSTISGNVAGEAAGGIWQERSVNSGDFLELHHTTVTNNAGFFSMVGGAENVGAGIAVRGNVTVQLHGSVVAANITCTGDFPVGTEPPPPEMSNVGGSLLTDCLAMSDDNDVVGSFESWGGNVAGEGCELQASFQLPFGSIAHDTLLDLSAASFVDTTDYERELQLFCYAGKRRLATVGGDNLNEDPATHTGDVPPPTRTLYNDNVLTDLLGPLADNQGHTQTHAVPFNSPVRAAAESLEDPGDLADAFPSTAPLCPTTDQRRFVPGGGLRPLICDAGAYQSLYTASISADDMAQMLSLQFPDTDGDGISDAVDLEPGMPSALFSDLALGGIAQGEILDEGSQLLRVFDLSPNPSDGIVVLGLSSGGSIPALISACGETQQLFVEAGEIHFIHCPRQPAACVVATAQLTVKDRAELAVSTVFGGQVQLGYGSTTAGSVLSSGNLVLQHSNVGQDAIAHDAVIGAQDSNVEGAVSEGAYLPPRALPTRTVAVGSSNVTVNYDQVATLAPGSYGALLVRSRGSLSLNMGSYSFASITLENDAKLKLQGLVQIASQGAITVGDRVKMLAYDGSPAASDYIDWYSNASQVLIGYDTLWSGSLVAPLASVTVQDRTSVGGCLGARQVTLGFDSDVVSGRELAAILAEPTAEPPTTPGGGCTESSATELGAPGQQVTVPVGGCLRVKDGYPSWWGVRQMKLETTASGQYPLAFTWSNSCTGAGGSGLFTGDWQAQFLPGVSSACATIIDLQGAGSGNATLRYWAQ